MEQNDVLIMENQILNIQKALQQSDCKLIYANEKCPTIKNFAVVEYDKHKPVLGIFFSSMGYILGGAETRKR